MSVEVFVWVTFVVREERAAVIVSPLLEEVPLESRILSHDSDVSTFVQIDVKRYEATL